MVDYSIIAIGIFGVIGIFMCYRILLRIGDVADIDVAAVGKEKVREKGAKKRDW